MFRPHAVCLNVLPESCSNDLALMCMNCANSTPEDVDNGAKELVEKLEEHLGKAVEKRILAEEILDDQKKIVNEGTSTYRPSPN